MKVFAESLLDELAAKAAASPRGRAHHNIHASAADPLQRFFVVADRRSYFRPHRHHTRADLATVLRGGFDLLTFDEAGCVMARWSIGAGTNILACETPPMTCTRCSRAAMAPPSSRSSRVPTIRRRRLNSRLGRRRRAMPRSPRSWPGCGMRSRAIATPAERSARRTMTS
jgi:cupin fold WbuC family metalloprotein